MWWFIGLYGHHLLADELVEGCDAKVPGGYTSGDFGSKGFRTFPTGYTTLETIVILVDTIVYFGNPTAGHLL